MGQNIKSLRTRIRSVDSTRHLTRAMGLVASSKMKRALHQMNNGREYVSALHDVMELLSHSAEAEQTRYMKGRGETDMLIVIAGDRGLAGGYNANVLRMASTFPDATLTCIGKKACEKFGQETVSSESFSSEQAAALAETLCREFREGKYRRVGILGTTYQSMMTQTPEIRWLLPLSAAQEEESTKTSDDGTVFEPDVFTVLEEAVPSYVAGVLFARVRESFACEVAARRMAMDSADKNAAELIDRLQLQYNRARQNAITQELTEIVAGSGL